MSKPTSGIVQSVDRALGLLETLSQQSGGMRVSDLALSMGLPVSTTHRLLTTMEQRLFVQQNAQSDLWFVGPRAHSVGERYLLHDGLVLPALPFLRKLRDKTRETANLGVLQNEEAVTIAQVESREILRAIAPPGGRVPILNSGMGKAIVATWPDEAIRTLIERQGLRRMTSHSLGSEQEVFQEIAKIREQGYALDNEEYIIGMRCVASVVYSAQGDAIAALSVSGLAARLTDDKLPGIIELVQEQAVSLKDRLLA